MWRQPWPSAIRAATSASRSAAVKSAASSTRCTSVPTCSPTGIAASGDGWPRRAASATSTGSAAPATSDGGGSSASCSCSGSLATRGSLAPEEMSLNEVRRQRASSPRSNCAADRPAAVPAGADHDTGRPSRERSTEMQPGACAASSSKRATATASVGVLSPAGGTRPSSPRANSSRPSAEWRLSHEPAHQTTA